MFIQLHCRVWQGGVLSHLLFAIYVDDLIMELRKSGSSQPDFLSSIIA